MPYLVMWSDEFNVGVVEDLDVEGVKAEIEKYKNGKYVQIFEYMAELSPDEFLRKF